MRRSKHPSPENKPEPKVTSGKILLIKPEEFAALRLDERAGAYTRRSHIDDEDDDRNASIVEQREEILDIADSDLRVKVGIEFCEGEGVGASRHSRKKRPMWEAALKALESREISTLLVYELSRADRLGVFGTDLGRLIERKMPGRVYVVDDELDTSDPRDRDRLIRSIEDARKEAERTSKRVRRTKKRRAAAGRWIGGHPPMGMVAEVDDKGKQTGFVLRDHAWWPLARRIAELALKGVSLSAVAHQLNLEGVRPKQAKAWTVPTISRFIKNPVIAGLQHADNRRPDSEGGGWDQDGKELRDENDEMVALWCSEDAPVITAAERTKIIALLEKRTAQTGLLRANQATRKKRGKNVAKTLLAGTDGVLGCVKCKKGGEATGRAHRPYYRCANKVCRQHKEGFTVLVEDADKAVTNAFLLTLRAEPAGSPLLTKVALRLNARLHPEAVGMRDSAEAAHADAKAELARIEDLVMDGVISKERAEERIARAKQGIAAAERALASVPAITADPTDLVKRLEDWQSLELPEKRALLSDAIIRVWATKVGQGKRGVEMTERLEIDWSEIVTGGKGPQLLMEPLIGGSARA